LTSDGSWFHLGAAASAIQSICLSRDGFETVDPPENRFAALAESEYMSFASDAGLFFVEPCLGESITLANRAIQDALFDGAGHTA